MSELKERYIIINSDGYVEGITFEGEVKTYDEQEAIEQSNYLNNKSKAKHWGLTFDKCKLILKGGEK